jgi:hypothetical protein
MNENIKWIAAAVAVVGLSIGAVLYLSYYPRGNKAAPAEEPVVAVPELPPAVPEEPAVKHPLPEPAAPEPLPPLAESDVPMRGALENLFGKESVEQFVAPENLVRNIVVTIDNLSTEKVPERIRPVKPTSGRFMVDGTEEAPALGAANFERYKPAVQLIRSLDTQQLVATYTRYYPLFQDAYANLGHPPEYFNDRLVEVIDHLLVTPELRGPVALTRPGVRYEFADPELESKSAGQKLLIRMGPDNAKVVKDKLTQLRAELIAKQAGPAPATE